MSVFDEWVQFPRQEPVSLGTEHLLEETVAQEVVIGIWVSTSNDNPRRGEAAVGMRIGGRDNPPLTQEEIEYVEAILTYARDSMRQRKRRLEEGRAGQE